jgi:2-keto-4-pentenoate hydratase/2-oxohepta-3-ene-1,7-dioic acid hydratase in catechol pathway
MKLITYTQNGRSGVAVLNDESDRWIDLTAAGIAPSMLTLVEAGPTGMRAVQSLLAAADAPILSPPFLTCAPIPVPRRNIFCVGKNYREHAVEFGRSGFDAAASDRDDVPEQPIVFSKATTSVIGPGELIPRHLDTSNSVDYEGELAVIIGRGGRAITRAEANAHIFGYTIINDVTAREAQKRHEQWLLGKSIDGFCPMGPTVVTADEIGDIGELQLITSVNDEVRQNASVRDLIFDVPTLIRTISAFITLLPGDIIATGTPAGVGIGFKPPRFLTAGDRVAVRIDPIGILENPVS